MINLLTLTNLTLTTLSASYALTPQNQASGGQASYSADDCSLCHSQSLPVALAPINDGPELNLPQYVIDL